MTDQPEPYEVDCPWFDPVWVLDHPNFPSRRPVALEEINTTKEASNEPRAQ